MEELTRGGASVTTFADGSGSNRLEQVVELAARLRAADPEWIVVVGGGSAIDGAKAARLLVERPDLDLLRPPIDLGEPTGVRCRLAAVPTTSGSGAEASGVADLVAPDGAPVELAGRTLTPAWAIVDPLFARGLPAPAVVDGALEALALGCEAYLSAWSNPFSDALAVAAARTVVRRLPHALRWSDDPDAREALHYAATQAGLAQANSQRGVAHALARGLGRATGLAYGRLLGIVLPAVLEFDRPGARDRLEELAQMLAVPEEGPPPTVAEKVRQLAQAAGAPADLAAAGVAPSALAAERARIVADTLRSPAVLANPRVPSAEDVERLLEIVGGSVR